MGKVRLEAKSSSVSVYTPLFYSATEAKAIQSLPCLSIHATPIETRRKLVSIWMVVQHGSSA